MERRRKASQLKAVEQPWRGKGGNVAAEHGSQSTISFMLYAERTVDLSIINLKVSTALYVI